MTSKDPSAPSFKQKAAQDFKDLVIISVYLAFFFCALTTYTMLLLKKYDVSYLNYSFAIINALVIAKVILIGQMVHFGTGAETRPLYQSVLYKSFVFGLLVLVFHFVEEFVKRLIRHDPAGTVYHNIKYDDLIGRSVIVFCVFIPLFAFIELRRALGEKTFYRLFLSPAVADSSGLSSAN